MKKSAVVVGTLTVAIAAYTGIAWWVGAESEKTIRASVERANQRLATSLGPDLGVMKASFDIKEYRRGVFSSEARYVMVVNDGEETRELAIQDHLQHGPFPWGLVRQGQFVPMLAYSRAQLMDTDTVKRWFDAARGAMPLSIETRVGMGGSGTSSWKFAPLESTIDDERLSFSGGELALTFDKDMQNSSGEGRFASLAVAASTGETVTLNDITLKSQTLAKEDDSVSTKSSAGAASLVFEGVADVPFKLEKIAAEFDSSQKDKLLNATLRYDVQRVLLGNTNFGSLSLGGKVARFNYDAFADLLAEYDRIAVEHGAEEGEDFELSEGDAQRLLTKARPAFASQPEIALQPLAWKNEKGESTLAVNVAFQPLPADASTNSETPPLEFLREMRVDLVLSRAMLLQAFAQAGGGEADAQQMEMLAAFMFDQYVEGLESEGLVRRDGDRALVNIVYHDGDVDVNGQVLSLYEFMDLFGDLL